MSRVPLLPTSDRPLSFLVTALRHGGAEHQLVELASRLQRRSWQVTVISMRTPEAHLDRLEAEGVEVRSLQMRPGVPNPLAIYQVAQLNRQKRPVVFHTFMVHANILGRVSRLLCWPPVLISSARNTFEGGRWREHGYRLTDRLCDLTTQVSRQGAERYASIGIVPRHKLRVIPNGVDTEKFAPSPKARQTMRHALGLNGELAWLTVGRLVPQKNHLHLLDTFRELVTVLPGNKLFIVGAGPLRNELETAIGRMRLNGRVFLLGEREDIPSLMNAADAFVLPSAWEGMPNVLLEAGACGLPLIATDAGATTDIIEQGVSGQVVKLGDRQELLRAMVGVARLPVPQRHLMGKRAREHVTTRFGMDAVVDQWEKLYLELLRMKGVQL